jgi:F-type H+-transporting ATPase subunit gamma
VALQDSWLASLGGSALFCQPSSLICLPFRFPPFSPAESFSLGATPTTREAQAIADEIFADFVSGEADKVELVYTKFVSLINSVPTVQTLLPLTPTGELCDLEGNCVDAADDEIFKLTTQVRGGT